MDKSKTRPALGVYTSINRDTALLVHLNEGETVRYLTMKKGYIQLQDASDEKFLRDFPLTMPSYPLLRALRLYESSTLRRTDETQRIMKRLIDRM